MVHSQEQCVNHTSWWELCGPAAKGKLTRATVPDTSSAVPTAIPILLQTLHHQLPCVLESPAPDPKYGLECLTGLALNMGLGSCYKGGWSNYYLEISLSMSWPRGSASQDSIRYKTSRYKMEFQIQGGRKDCKYLLHSWFSALCLSIAHLLC